MIENWNRLIYNGKTLLSLHGCLIKILQVTGTPYHVDESFRSLDTIF